MLKNGKIGWCSRAFCGNAPDDPIVIDAVNCIRPGRGLGYDKGGSRDLSLALQKQGSYLQAPMDKTRSMMTRAERDESAEIAKVRCHIERAFGILKKRFSILVSTISRDQFQLIDGILYACCFLNNLEGSIFKADQDEAEQSDDAAEGESV